MDVVEKNNFRDFLKKIYGENVERELSVEAI